MSRHSLAFIVAPLWVPVIVSFYAFCTFFPDFGPMGLVVIAVLTVGSAAISYGGTLVLGWPAFAFMRTHHMTSVWMAIATGFAIGAMTPLGFLILMGAMPVLAHLPGGGASGLSLPVFLSAAMGALVGATFWLIARPDRPVVNDR